MSVECDRSSGSHLDRSSQIDTEVGIQYTAPNDLLHATRKRPALFRVFEAECVTGATKEVLVSAPQCSTSSSRWTILVHLFPFMDYTHKLGLSTFVVHFHSLCNRIIFPHLAAFSNDSTLPHLHDHQSRSVFYSPSTRLFPFCEYSQFQLTSFTDSCVLS